MDFTFLTQKQIFGGDGYFGKKSLDIFEKIEKQAAITDFSILLGGLFSNSFTINGSGDLKDRTGYYWLYGRAITSRELGINPIGDIEILDIHKRNIGGRPVLTYSSISSLATNKVVGKDGVLRVEYGEYPQDSIPKTEQDIIENLYKQGLLNKDGRKYTTDSRWYNYEYFAFKGQTLEEYEYDGRKFVRVIANSSYDGNNFKLSNQKEYKDGDIVWVEVKPITWLVDEKADIAITEKIVFAGVQFCYKPTNKGGNFKNTDIKIFMDDYFAKQIIQPKIAVNIEQNKENLDDLNIDQNLKVPKNPKRENPYNLIFEAVSEEDIIKGCVLSGITPYLHGKSSEGKSARVKQLDPDCEIVYLRNATPESLNGKSVYDQSTGKMIDIPPSWYKRLKEKCEKEPHKIHILFLDELANALPSIQSMAFNLILDKEVDGKWQLPKNARIVAAGNDMKDSLAANQLAEPLFNRLAHVYIKTTVESWLKWASTPNSEYERLELQESKVKSKMHPAIYAFISYKGEKALRTEYNGEKPNADPRKWEMASKVLYETERPEMLRSLIGEELTKEFCQFCNQRVITLEDVLNDNYTEKDLNMSLSEKYGTIVALSQVDEENLEKVRKFISQMEPEYLSVFDSLWTRGDSLRLEKIAEIRMERGLNK